MKVIIEKFPKTLQGSKKAKEYLISINKYDFSIFLHKPSMHDIINYANKLWNENNELNVEL